eukprot:gene25633-30774_t
MELRHFRCVLAVAHSLHFARAAAELGISPPALTKQQLAQAQETARRAGRGELGRLEIGYVASAAYAGVLQGQFARFRASHPGIHIGAREYAMDALPALLDQGRVDLAFVRPPLHYPDGIDSVVLLRDHVARPGAAQPAALAQQAFIVPEQEWGTLEVSRRGGFAAQVASRPGSLVAVLTEVSLGVGCAIVPHSVMASVQLPGVVFRELAGPQISSEIAAAFRRHEQAPAARAFIGQLRAAALSGAGRRSAMCSHTATRTSTQLVMQARVRGAYRRP